MLLLSITASAQHDDPACLTHEWPEASPRTIQKSAYPFCSFTENYINSGCLTTYIRVNLHFFVDSDCTGVTAAAATNNQLEQQLAFQRADQYITTTNAFLANMSENPQWNQAEWGAPVTPGQCVMLRLVLNDVYIHCESRNLTVGDGNDNFSYYNQDFGEAFNNGPLRFEATL
ncbi:hypothetical protein QWY85_17120 [Neolewinella lacunae]|uniref:Uncharacterized protein n=1 Tax=Neolewinella lacunae TaxID=1517758 RepID=A0A923PSE0_9BACT|nr:hypothetical protein [Neolewinella lacunae]MBC6995917.1 hypothetical protein [Neolewinella lacunae]MDN3636390.1 hypothetical protein [Neolewinella lacunae]